MKKSSSSQWIIVPLLIFAIVISAGCGLLNKAPEISSLIADPQEVGPGGTSTITCAATDPDGDALTYSWTVSGGAISGTGNSVSWTAPTTLGNYTITVTVDDGQGKTADKSITMEVSNTPPQITGVAPSANIVIPEGSCTISCQASDADGDTLIYTWTASGGAISGLGSLATWTAPASEGTYTIAVTVSDGKGGSASDSCTVVVEQQFGTIDVQSTPAGAAVYLDGEDTGNITPYILTNLTPGSHTIELRYYHHQYKQQLITVNPGETTYINWSLLYAPTLTTTIQPTDTTGKDAYVYNLNPDKNYATNSYLYASTTSDEILRSYLQFDLSSLPEEAVATSVHLELYYTWHSGATTAPIGAYEVESPWSETAIAWNNQPSSATAPEYIRNVYSGTMGNYIYWSIPNMVNGWLEDRSSNHGVLLKDTDESTAEDWKAFYSSDWSDPNKRPKLVIQYYDPTP